MPVRPSLPPVRALASRSLLHSWPLAGRRSAFSRLLPPDPVEVHPVDHSVPARGVLFVGQPEALVQLPLAVPVRRAEPHRIHHQDPPIWTSRETLGHDRVAGRGTAGAYGGNHRPARADLDRQLPPAKRHGRASLVVLTVLQRVAGRGVPEVVELGLLHEGGPAWLVAAARELVGGKAGAGSDAAPLHPQHLLRLTALAGLVRRLAEKLHDHLPASRPAPVVRVTRGRRETEAQDALLASFLAGSRGGSPNSPAAQHTPIPTKQLNLLPLEPDEV